ncbi:MAG: OmpH family outer membrane protein [Rikenellaceae bacterium]|nr:OmpH family outer membrane protein [Rikenellaceae bacterium]
MKKIFLMLALTFGLATMASAQNYAVVNSEKVFKSIEAYNDALKQLDTLAEQYQKQVDEKFEAVETLYNTYMERKSSLSAASQKANEDNILQKEQEATEFQESLFGSEGTLMKKRVELIQPIQQKVFKAIEQYAQAKGYDMIIDIAQNATMLYYSPKADKTEDIILLVK